MSIRRDARLRGTFRQLVLRGRLRDEPPRKPLALDAELDEPRVVRRHAGLLLLDAGQSRGVGRDVFRGGSQVVLEFRHLSTSLRYPSEAGDPMTIPIDVPES